MLDLTIFVGSHLQKKSAHSSTVSYQDVIPADLRPYMLNTLMGIGLRSTLKNGDIIFDINDVRAGHFEGLRTLPPKAPSDVPRVAEVVKMESYRNF